MSKLIEFDFSPDAFARMESIRERTGTSTYGDVIRNAIRVYEWMHEVVNRSGLEIAAIKDGEIVRVVKLLG